MAATDDLEIKDEIEAIADRIDNILKTVKRHYPITEIKMRPKRNKAHLFATTTKRQSRRHNGTDKE